MNSTQTQRLFTLRLILILTGTLAVQYLWEKLPSIYGKGSFLGFSGVGLLAQTPLFLELAASILFFALSFTKRQRNLLQWAEIIRARLPAGRVSGWIFFMVLLLAASLLNVFKLSNPSLPVIWLFGHLVLAEALCLDIIKGRKGLLGNLGASALIFSGAFFMVTFSLTQISNNPLTLGWSEASSYYYASLFFARRIYGISLPLPVLDPGRFLLHAIPFLVSGLPLWVHRLWQALLWLGFTLAVSAALLRRLKLPSRAAGWVAGAWFFLFFFQGPIYYHLMLAALIVLLGFNSRRPLLSTLIVLLASVWAGLSRINWFPVPGVLAAVLYILEVPLAEKPGWRYWWMPCTWAVSGTLTALAAKTVYIPLSGNPPDLFNSSLSSPLLWYRLLPNATYAPGLILGLLVTVLPILVIATGMLLTQVGVWNLRRLVALAAVLVVFPAGGTAASLKIGGGSNLHNFDAFLLLLAVAVGYVYFGRFTPDQALPALPSKAPAVWLALAVALPVITAVMQKPVVYKLPPSYNAQQAALQLILDQANLKDGRVLFVIQRHWITFDIVHGVAMQPEYERVFLMEMAMADNQAYLQTFEDDLKTHRYALVIFENLASGRLETRQSAFSDENNAWHLRVMATLVNYYRLLASFPALDLDVLEPCPGISCAGD
jgi:hypothetical protein